MSSRKARLQVAPSAVGIPLDTPAPREELWLAIYLPRLAFEALNTESSLAAMQLGGSAPSSQLAQGSFQQITREIQQGSRRGFAADRLHHMHQRGQMHSAVRELSQRANRTTEDNGISPCVSITPDRIVVIEAGHNQQRVVACNEAAQAAGVQVGMALNAAYAVAGDLDVRARNPQAEQQMLDRLAQWAGCFTSRVCVEPPDALLLEIKGSLRLFGGAKALVDLALAGLAKKNIQATLAVAPTSLAALVFSRTGQGSGCLRRAQLPGALSQVPITAMRWTDDITATLRSMGVQTIGDCLRLPREGFARRFGPATLLQLDQLLGRAAQPRHTFVARERFSWKLDFEAEIESHPHLLHVIAPVFDEMERFLRSRQSGVQSIEVRLRHRDCDATRVVLRFVRPEADAAHIVGVLTERLERVVLPAPVLAARVRSGPLWPLEMETLPHRALADQTQVDVHAVTRVIERLRARLGHEAVYSLKRVAEHRPELASKLSEPDVGRRRAKKREIQQQQSRSTMQRPFWLLPAPQALEAKRSWPCYQGKLELCQGPERIESGWWDGNDVSRDYYIARTAHGVRLWIFRERKSRQWFLHGVYG